MGKLQGLAKFKIDGSAGSLKNIQRVYVNFNSGTTMDVTIDPVNTSNTIVRLNYNTFLSAKYGAVAPTLINSTTVRLTRGATSASNLYVNVVVEEYYCVKSKQVGSISYSEEAMIEQDVTIDEVDVNKCIIITNIYGNIAATEYMYYHGAGRLKNSTTLGITGGNNGWIQTIVYQILELF
jgi:hypothetical protein